MPPSSMNDHSHGRNEVAATATANTAATSQGHSRRRGRVATGAAEPGVRSVGAVSDPLGEPSPWSDGAIGSSAVAGPLSSVDPAPAAASRGEEDVRV
ncbi:hypothetical protein GCM10023322_80030 [Rugosimonospora acidiphila]|uniref:Uncharacterized protein n=1 Tax=Rugosimonospora acidiphila TaxID=556531 RepID=A0ABP9SUI2_9ACTN